MILRFAEWLVDQQDREDFVGDLARIPSMQNIDREVPRSKFDEHKNWADIVIKIDEPGHIAVFNEAWQEFLLAKKQAANSTLD